MESADILVIDEDRAEAHSIVEELKCLGFDTLLCVSPPEVIEALKRRRYTAVVAAESMRGMPARSLLRTLKRQGTRTPVVVAGPGRSVDGVVALFRAGATDYLRLPDRLSDLGDILDRLASDAGDRDAAPAAPPERARHDHAASPAAEPEAAAPKTPGGTARTATRSPIARLVEDLREGKVELPAMAHIAQQVQQMMSALDTPLDDVIEVVGQDPVVSGSLLHLANSAELRGRNPATDLRTSCIRLGNRRVLTLAQQILLRDHFRFGDGLVREVVEGMWENSVATAFIARHLAEACGVEDLDEVYLMALLHNIGELVLLKLFVELRDGADLDRASLHGLADELARHHELVGRLLLASWDAPKSMLAVASGHHLASRRITTPSSKLSAICLASWTLACEHGFSYLPGHDSLRAAPHLRRLRISQGAVADLPVQAREWVDAHTDH